MTKQEFEKLARVSLTGEAYKIIETAYSNSELDKVEFVKSNKWLIGEVATLSKAQTRIFQDTISSNIEWARKYYDDACNQYQVDFIYSMERYLKVVAALYGHLKEFYPEEWESKDFINYYSL